ncbi:MAG: DEAD/DEAH box helicase, partial [Deferribacteraceae bacterium]|nr:DEAD/DEAH box helicase [Deferribacteraceae bacterium]
MDKLATLKESFGHTHFRKGQEELIDSLLAGRDVLGVMPTGAGKSICYQLPALLLPGCSIVVSPLISLMHDQVSALSQAGISAAFINSSLSAGEYAKVLRNAALGAYKIIYVAPERLHVDSFLQFAMQADISLVTVDEAHCVSQWGQDFRPSYTDIYPFIKKLSKRPVVSAFTATATPEVRSDIIRLLGLA